MQISKTWAVVLSLFAIPALQGCGGGDGPADKTTTTGNEPHKGTTTTTGKDATTTTSTTTTTTSTTTTTTTTTTLPRTAPMSAEEAVKHFNTLYKGYTPGDETSSIGVVMRTADWWGAFCKGFKADLGCYQGFARCITSASILNSMVMMDNQQNHIFLGLRRHTGMMFNTSLVESKLGRCTYQFDGGSWGRYHRGCGSTAPNGVGFCKKKLTAWSDIDPHTGEVCTDDAKVVVSDYCPNRQNEPKRVEDQPCFWKGPAFPTTGGPGKSETHKMLEQRVRNQGVDYSLTTTWDEVVLDAELLLEELWRDPALAVPAMVYAKSWDEGRNNQDRATAHTMAKDMQEEFNMESPVPVIGVNTLVDIRDKDTPFFYEASESEELQV